VPAPPPRPYRLFGAEMSYFTAKVRPAFRVRRLWCEEVLATPSAYRNVILPRTGLAFIPVVVTPGDETWQDTSEILDALDARHPGTALLPATARQRVTSLLLELYADEFLLFPAMHYRWSFPESERRARADFAATNGDPEAAGRFADAMKGATRAALGVGEETAPAIEAHTADLLDALETHFAAHPYLLGARPSLADCALMGPLYGHLYQDAVPGRLLRERAPRTCHWIQRMNHPDPDAFGDWLPDDALPPTLTPLLGLVGADAAPAVLASVAVFEQWAEARPEGREEPPRAVGRYRAPLRGAEADRAASSYTLWMLQRPLDAWRALSAPERATVDAALAGTGCERLMAATPRHRLGKRSFKLVVEPG